jgi:alpha-N-arabinofuranosidase
LYPSGVSHSRNPPHDDETNTHTQTRGERRCARRATAGGGSTLVAATLGLANGQCNAQTAHIEIDADAQGVPISPVLYGIFFEEINHAGDGGLYAELVRNRSFEDADTPQAWTLLGDGAKMVIDTANPLNSRNLRSLRLEIAGSASLVNEGYWGIAVRRGKRYRFSMYARCDGQFRGALTVSLQSAERAIVRPAHAARVRQGLEAVLGDADRQRNRPEGAIGANRQRRRRAVAGYGLADACGHFQAASQRSAGRPCADAGCAQAVVRALPRAGASWRATACTTPCAGATRSAMSPNDPPRWCVWGYTSTQGLGLHEYLLMCKDLGAEPMLVVNCGMACQYRNGDHIPLSELDEWIEDALAAIEYAIGPPTSQAGARCGRKTGIPNRSRCAS